MFLVPKEIQHQFWDYWTHGESVLRKVPKLLRREIKYINEHKPSGMAYIITKNDNVYQLSEAIDYECPDDYDNINDLCYRLLPAISNLGIDSIQLSFYSIFTFTKTKVYSLRVSETPEKNLLTCSEVKFDSDIRSVWRSSIQSASVLLTNGDLHFIHKTDNVRMNLHSEKLNMLGSGSFLNAGITNSGKILVWSKLTVPETYKLEIQNDEATNAKIKNGFLFVLTKNSNIYYWDFVQLTFLTMYHESVLIAESDEEDIKEKLNSMINHIPTTEREKLMQDYEVFLSDRNYELPNTMMFPMNIKCKDFLPCQDCIYILDEQKKIWKWKIPKQGSSSMEHQPELLPSKSWRNIAIQNYDQFPVKML